MSDLNETSGINYSDSVLYATVMLEADFAQVFFTIIILDCHSSV